MRLKKNIWGFKKNDWRGLNFSFFFGQNFFFSQFKNLVWRGSNKNIIWSGLGMAFFIFRFKILLFKGVQKKIKDLVLFYVVKGLTENPVYSTQQALQNLNVDFNSI